MPEYKSFSKQDSNVELLPEMSLLTGETLSTDIRLVEGVFDLKLSVTSQQYNTLLSAAIEGAYAAYPDDYNNVIAPLILAGKRLADTMSCDDVADCIETSQAVRDAITEMNDEYGTTNPNYLSPTGTESTTIINNRFPPSERDESIKDNPPSCDKDALWAGIRYMVERMDENGRDWLEGIVSKADVWQRIIEFAGTVPIVGELAENVLKAVVENAEDLLNAYNTHSSTAELDNIACDLFEMVCAECRYPTFQEIADYYANFGITGIQDWANLGLKAIVDYVTASNGLASLVVYFTVNTFQLWVLYAEATFFNARAAKTLTIWADIGEDNPNNGWELLCSGCEDEWCYQFDLSLWQRFDWSIQAGTQLAGTFVDPIWEASVVDLNTHDVTAIGIEFDVTSLLSELTLNMTRIECDYTAIQGNGVLGTDYAARIRQLTASRVIGYDSLTDAPNQPAFGTTLTWSIDMPANANTKWFQFMMSVDDTSGTPSGSGELTAIRIYGTGTPPSFSGNCV